MFGTGIGMFISGIVITAIGFLVKRSSEKDMEKPMSDEDLSALSGCASWLVSIGIIGSGGVLTIVGAILAVIARIFS